MAGIEVFNTTTDDGIIPTTNYDHNGAKNFIIITVLVYSLMGTLTVMLLRMCRRAKYTERVEEVVNEYLRMSGELKRQADRQQMQFHARKTQKVLDDRKREFSADPRELPAIPSANARDGCVAITIDDTDCNTRTQYDNTPSIRAPLALPDGEFIADNDVTMFCVEDENAPRTSENSVLIVRHSI